MQFEKKDFFIEDKARDYAWSMYKFHFHNSYEIYYLTSGKRTMLFEQKFYDMKPGDLLLMRPNILHKGSGADAHRKLGIEFSSRFLDHYFTQSMQKELLRCYNYSIIHLNQQEQEKFTALYKEVYSEYANKRLYAVPLSQILVLLNNAGIRQERETRGLRESKNSVRINNIISYIEENHRIIKSVDEIAEHTYLSKSYLCRLFKKETNMTIMEYLYNYRIQQACEKLASTADSISDIAHWCGFESPSHFTKMFRAMLGCTPGQFRREHIVNI